MSLPAASAALAASFTVSALVIIGRRWARTPAAFPWRWRLALVASPALPALRRLRRTVSRHPAGHGQRR